MRAADIVERLGLEPHPEGGMYRETWRDPDHEGRRGSGTAIYFLLRAGEVTRWHRIDAAEIWHHYTGSPSELRLSLEGETPTQHVLGSDLAAGHAPQIVVPTGCWQSARTLGGWTLAGCTVSPAFRVEGFELAPEGWEPGA